MNNNELAWIRTATDGIRIEGRAWSPGGRVAGVLCIVHGMGEHCGRYAPVAAYFNDRGWAVVSYDHRGHGRSGGPRGHTPSYAALLDGMDILLEEASTRYSSVPQFVWGHSMGGNVAINYALERRPAWPGLIVTAPWLRLAFEPPALQVALGKVMNVLWPSFTQASKLNPDYLSRDIEVGRRYAADPLVHDRISARFFMACRAAGRRALANAGRFPVPVLLMHGSDDKLIAVEGSREFAGRAGERCTYVEYPGAYHELHFEFEKEEVLRTMWNYIQQHAGIRPM